jgi:hypothetical protein
VRVSILTAAIMTGFWAGACSKPAGDEGSGTSLRATPVIVTPPSEIALTSDLEAGNSGLALVRPVAQKKAGPLPVRAAGGTARVSTINDNTAAALAALVPTVGTAATEENRELAAPGSMPQAHALGSGRGAAGGDLGDGDGRGPMVIIRGGPGTLNDPCDLHGRGGGTGIAINSRMPALMGGRMGGPSYAPRLGGGRMGGMRSRGGIR